MSRRREMLNAPAHRAALARQRAEFLAADLQQARDDLERVPRPRLGAFLLIALLGGVPWCVGAAYLIFAAVVAVLPEG